MKSKNSWNITETIPFAEIVLASLICIKVLFLIRKYQKWNSQIFRNVEKLTTLSVNLESVTCSRHNRYLFFLVGGFALELPCHNFCGFRYCSLLTAFWHVNFFGFVFYRVTTSLTCILVNRNDLLSRPMWQVRDNWDFDLNFCCFLGMFWNSI